MQARIRVEVLWPSHNQIENYFCNLIPNSYHCHVKFYKHRRLAYAQNLIFGLKFSSRHQSHHQLVKITNAMTAGKRLLTSQ